MTPTLALTPLASDLDRYLEEIGRFPLLDREQEHALACRFREHGDIDAAHRLVVSNLRFVVKIAREYHGYGCNLIDMIQEGNIGLMQAVKKFDPHKGYRLITYAVWWIRAHIQGYIMRTWSMVKLGTGRVSKRLFFKLRSTRARLGQEGPGAPEPFELARALDAPEEDVTEMAQRLAARDFYLDAPIDSALGATHADQLVEDGLSPEDTACREDDARWVGQAVEAVRSTLSDKETYVLDHRLLSDEPRTLEEVGREFGITRERVRQIESRLLDKLRERIPA